MAAKLIKSYTLPVELAERVERLALEHFGGNRSEAVRALISEALPVLETLPGEATKTA
jgi:metal-responsive CopG/Arc/MetJ family transcriptional regulator